jgi:Holliday junction resolvase RusA-like endonuclease
MGVWTTADLEKRGFVVKDGKAQRKVREELSITNDAIKTKLYLEQRGFDVKKDSVVLLVTPCPKPRMTRSDKWNKRPAVLRYRAFCDAIRAAAEEQSFTLPDSHFHITFYLPIPKTHLKRELEGKPHQQKPDVDNLTKAIFDALCKQDQVIWDYRSTKLYSSEPRIEISKM